MTPPFYKRNRTQICSFYTRGECIKGAECPYRHEMQEISHHNNKDRQHGVYDPVTLRPANKTSDTSSLKPPEDESIKTLYVGGVGRLTEQDIRDYFGEVESILISHQRSGALVTFRTREAAEKAANELNNKLLIKGHRITLMWGKLPKAANQDQQPQLPPPPPLPRSVDNQEGSGAVLAEKQTMSSGGGKRSLDSLEEMSPQEMRERVMKRNKKCSTPAVQAAQVSPVPPIVTSSGETSRFVTSFPLDFLTETLWPDAESLLFPGPMHQLEKKSDIELVNEATQMTLKAVQAVLMSRRRLLGQLGQQDTARMQLSEAEANIARLSTELREATSQIKLLKAAAATVDERVAAADEARKASDALLMIADAQLRETTEKMRLQSERLAAAEARVEELQEELKDATSTASLRARAKLMKEFLDGKSSLSDAKAEIDFYCTHIGDEADLVSKDHTSNTSGVGATGN